MSNSLSLYEEFIVKFIVRPMLSFDLSAMDIVLAIAAVTILLLYVTKLAQSTPRSEPVAKEKKAGVYARLLGFFKSRKTVTIPQAGSSECPHYFGYLKSVPKDGSIPEKCYTCPRMMQCASSSE